MTPHVAGNTKESVDRVAAVTVATVLEVLATNRDLPLIALLYFVFGIICIKGLRDWRRSLVEQPAAVRPAYAAADR